ncbi:glycosyltransferase family 2 protein [Alkalisalibacterium limincola]|uniref:Glycosyltransferase family 2 protein n=1 Tax=Alkalisalibacterium limincola TaxID=2699169 RepID=A0A5C8KHA5_9GAMM|nr:glycosyltransferase family 2 protein [Alkalisalibacterium limincola]TXK59855.1 glycosyltransferase family 2 protein [Alkalisalibacterium limincola]
MAGTPVDMALVPGDGARIESDGRILASRRAASLVLALDGPLPTRALPGGWYWLGFTIQSEDATAVGATLSVSMRSGQVPGESFLLPEPDEEGRIGCLLMFPYEVHELRLVPSVQRGRYRIQGLGLSRLGKGRALASMLLGLSGKGWPDRPRWSVRASLGFLSALRSQGLGPATTALYRAYREQFVAVDRGYSAWVRYYDTLSGTDLQILAAQAEALAARGPLVSILLPVYDTPEAWLRSCIDSVLAQTYPRWELCICDDASPQAHVARVLEDYARRDARIKVVSREENGHISRASNSALELATGEFVALLDHDDELRPHALQTMVSALVDAPGARFAYSDEDKIDAEGNRFDPYFKPAWDRELVLGQNYLCHLSVVDTALVREVGGFRPGFEGSQDHDLFLRCTARLADGQILHVPKVLYHWRAIPGSTALGRGEKDYASEAGRRAVASYLEHNEPGAQVESLSHGHYRVLRPLPAPPPRVAIIIPTRDRVDLLRTCVESVLERTDYPAFEVIIVDNQSREPETLAYLDEVVGDARVRVLEHDQAFNYSAINNHAVSTTDADVVCLLNNDIEVIEAGWLAELVARAVRPGVGAVGAKLLYPDDTIQHAGVVLGVMGVANHAFTGFSRDYPGHGGRARVAQCYSAVTGACLVVTRERYLAVGGLDEALAVAFNDIDFCLRLRASGFVNQWSPFATLYHHESATRGSDVAPEKAARFLGEVRLMETRWEFEIGHDPAYNPNLTLDASDFGFAFPPRGLAAGEAGMSIGRRSVASPAQSR